MKEYERDLRKIIALSNGGCEPVCLPAADFAEPIVRYLSACGFITLLPAGDDEFYATIAPKGLTYFDDKKSARNMRWIDRISGFIAGVLTTVLGGLILQWLLR